MTFTKMIPGASAPTPSQETIDMKTITVRIERHYGNRHVYPACKTAKALQRLSGTRETLTDHAINIIKNDLGYQINVEAETL
jgi:hypothetical protein